MKKITNFQIDTTNLTEVVTNRSFVITGDEGAEFMLQVYDAASPEKYYDFANETFSNGFDSTKNLKIKMEEETYVDNVTFPASTNDRVFVFLLLADPNTDTELNLGKNKYIFTQKITGRANTTLTFAAATASNSASYQTLTDAATNITSEASPSLTFDVTKGLDWDFKNTVSDAQGFGLRLIRQPIDTDWYFTKSQTVNGAVSAGTFTIVLDAVDDLVVGMYISGVSSGSLAVGSTIKSVDIDTKTITISEGSEQEFADGITLTFQARGSKAINRAIKASIDFSSWTEDTISAVSAELSKTTRNDASSTTRVDLTDTYGISGGGFVTVKGINFVNTGTNTVQTVNADADGTGTDGYIVMQLDQTTNSMAQGSKLYFTGSAATITVKNNIVINSHPPANRTIYLALDNFITPGVAAP